MNDRKKQTFSFDFAGRKIVEETPDIHFDPDELMKSDTSIFDCQDFSSLEFPADLHPVVSFMLMNLLALQLTVPDFLVMGTSVFPAIHSIFISI